MKLLLKKWDHIKEHTKLSRKEFLDGLELILNSSYFSYNNKFYSQTFGVSMGEKTSPIISEIIMQHLENSVIDQIPFNIPFYKRYVDDIFIPLPYNKIESTLKFFNSFHNKLQFTFEKENNNSLSFLDMKIIRLEDTSLKINWYRKPTWSGRYLNFMSSHPNCQKK